MHNGARDLHGTRDTLEQVRNALELVGFIATADQALPERAKAGLMDYLQINITQLETIDADIQRHAEAAPN